MVFLPRVRATQWIKQQLQRAKVKSLRLRNLNQDAVENFFCSIRQCCCSSTEVTTTQFTAALKTCLITRFSSKASDKNCADDDSFLLGDLRTLLQEGSTEQSGENTEPSLVRGNRPVTSDEDHRAVSLQAQGSACPLHGVLKKLNLMDCAACVQDLTTTERHSAVFFVSQSSSSFYPPEINATLFSVICGEDSSTAKVCCLTLWSCVSGLTGPGLHVGNILMFPINCKNNSLSCSLNRCRRSNMLSKDGVFNRTRQILSDFLVSKRTVSCILMIFLH